MAEGSDSLTRVGLIEPRGHTREIIAGAIAIMGTLGVGSLIFLSQGVDPLSAYFRMLQGIFGSPSDIRSYLTEITPLLVIGLGLAISFKARLWNIGAEGQFVGGALVGGVVAINLADAPGYLGIPLSLVAGVAGGAAAGWLVGILKARWDVNEVITSLLLNFIIAFAYNYSIRQPFQDPATYVPESAPVPEHLELPEFPSIEVHIGFVIGLILIPLVWHVLANTRFGFRVRMIGENRSAAHALGVRDRRMIVQILSLSGALAGLAGAIQILGVQHRLVEGISPGYGFTAIIVAVIGSLTPVGVLIGASLVAALTVGGEALQRFEEIPAAIIDVLNALLIVFAIVARRFVRNE